MKIIPLALLISVGTALSALAQSVLNSGHVDIGIAYDAGAWNLHVHKEEPPPAMEFAPGDVILGVGSNALTAIPGGPAFSFLGPPGEDVWILPKFENPSLLFLGIGSEELTATDWIGNLTLTLKAVTGPGNFALWDTDAFGTPIVFMNAADGINSADQLSVIPGSHAHFFYGFTAPGEYRITLEAAGTHTLNGFTQSGNVTYLFSVVPEPGILSLLAVGGAAFVAVVFRWKSRRAAL